MSVCVSIYQWCQYGSVLVSKCQLIQYVSVVLVCVSGVSMCKSCQYVSVFISGDSMGQYLSVAPVCVSGGSMC